MSFSVGAKTFEDLKTYSKKVVEALPVEEVAVITFATVAKVAIPFGPKADVMAKIDSRVVYKGGATYLGEAIDKAVDILQGQTYVVVNV